MNICSIASAAAAEELNTFRLRFFGKTFEWASRQLYGLKFIGKLGQTGETRHGVRCPECGRLCRDRNTHRLPHLPYDRQHAVRLLFTIGSDDVRSFIYHRTRAIGW